MTPRIEVSLSLTGVFDPDEITGVVGLTPTGTFRQGAQISDTKLQHRWDGWRISTGERDSLSLDEQVQAVLRQLEGREARIRDICVDKSIHAEIACAVYVEDETPALCLDPDVVKMIAGLGASIDIDLYILGSETTRAR